MTIIIMSSVCLILVCFIVLFLLYINSGQVEKMTVLGEKSVKTLPKTINFSDRLR